MEPRTRLYAVDPAVRRLAEAIAAEFDIDGGPGIMAAPAINFTPNLATDHLRIAAVDIADYHRDGYDIAVVGISELPDLGLWWPTLSRELTARSIDLEPHRLTVTDTPPLVRESFDRRTL